jgi:uncharacterized phage protein gp47/JayE
MPKVATRNLNEVVNKIRNTIERTTGLNSWDRGSFERYLVEAVSTEVIEIVNETNTVLDQTNIGTANGEELIRLGKAMGVEPKGGTFAFADKAERTVKFYVVSGNFGGINGGIGFTIPAGTVISSDPTQNEFGERVRYVLTETVILGQTQTEKFVSVRADFSGSKSNVGAGVLLTHNFTTYTQAALNTLKVTNVRAIINGAEEESQQSYRNRLISYFASIKGLNESRIRFEALNYPGINRVAVAPEYFGVGTVAVFCFGPEGVMTQAILNSFNQKLNSLKLPGTFVTALPGVKVRFDMEIKATLEVSSDSIKRKTEYDIRKELLTYFSTLAEGERFSKRELERRLSTIVGEDIDIDRVVTVRSYGEGFGDDKITLREDSYTLERFNYGMLGNVKISYVKAK